MKYSTFILGKRLPPYTLTPIPALQDPFFDTKNPDDPLLMILKIDKNEQSILVFTKLRIACPNLDGGPEFFLCQAHLVH